MTAGARSIAILLALGASAGAGAFAVGETSELIEAAGRDLTIARCIVCHSVDYIEMNAPVLDRAGWQKSIRKMIDRFGAPVTAEEASVILEYLANTYSSASPATP